MQTSSSHSFHRGSAAEESHGRRAVAAIVFAIIGASLGCGGSEHTPAAPTHPPLAVYSIAPSSGPPAGGNRVAIFGMGFRLGISITFDGAAATDIFIVDGRTLTATVPAHATGAVDVIVSGPDGQVGELTRRYQYSECGGGCWDYDRTSSARRRP